jgi:glycerol-1-phosphatase
MPLADRYAGVVLDIDGVVVLDGDALPGAGVTVAALRAAGLGLQLATNNASRTPEEIAASLRAVGVEVGPEEVLTSALVAAEMLEPGTACLVIGMSGLRGALEARGCRTVHDHAEAEAVVVGWDRDLVWDDLRRATLALTRGARFVATNTDASYPTAHGPWPGNGATFAALATVLLGSTDGRRGWMHRLAVTPGARRAGLGGALVAEAERRMARRGLAQVNLLHFSDNVDAAAFWERQGYGAVGPTTLRTKRL